MALNLAKKSDGVILAYDGSKSLHGLNFDEIDDAVRNEIPKFLMEKNSGERKVPLEEAEEIARENFYNHIVYDEGELSKIYDICIEFRN